MKTVEIAGQKVSAECSTDTPLSSGLLSLALELPMACGGQGRCATCHILVVEGAENLSPIEPREERALGLLSQRAPNSRLSCQARLLGNVSVKVPDADFISVVEELERMIGKRASRDLLHSTDGRVLVAKGQVITRYVVQKLKQTM